MTRKFILSLGMFALVLLVMMVPKVAATSWAELAPEEVDQKAEVIVSGTYDFSSKRIPSNFVFSGATFNVENVYRGEASEQIIAGIDMYDEGWVEEFQDEGGEFLLFLEESKEASFLIPVAGPNGMIRMKDGNPAGKNKDFYETILQGESKAPSVEESKTPEKKKDLPTLVLVGIVIIIGSLGGFLIYRRLRKR